MERYRIRLIFDGPMRPDIYRAFEDTPLSEPAPVAMRSRRFWLGCLALAVPATAVALWLLGAL